MKTLFHQHVLIKAYVTNPPRSEETINNWLTDLVSAIDMKICISPRSVYVDAVGNRGLTGQVGIETSHIAIHVWDESNPGMVQMDVYSCKEFNPETVIQALTKFNLVRYELMLIDRNDGFVIKDHKTVSL